MFSRVQSLAAPARQTLFVPRAQVMAAAYATAPPRSVTHNSWTRQHTRRPPPGARRNDGPARSRISDEAARGARRPVEEEDPEDATPMPQRASAMPAYLRKWIGARAGTENLTAYTYAQEVRKWLDRHDGPLSASEVEEMVALVVEPSPAITTAPVWNLVLARLGREGKYQRMWKAFNQKRGTRPSSRTYTTLLNAYTHIRHAAMLSANFSPAARPPLATLERVRNIYDQSQAHIRAEIARIAPPEVEDTGIAYPFPSQTDDLVLNASNDREVSIAPTNAYLKFLGRFGLWEDMEAIFVALDRIGPLAPDEVTFSAMLMTANNIDHYARSPHADKVDLPPLDVGAVARSYLDQAIRQLCGPEAGSRRFDEPLALAALQCLGAGSPADRRLAEALVPRLWDLRPPGQPATAAGAAADVPLSTYAAVPKAWMEALPAFRLSVSSATSVLTTLARMGNRTLAAHYTRAVLDDPYLARAKDMPLLRVCITNLAAAGDTYAAAVLLDDLPARDARRGWPTDVYLALVAAARWDADWDMALSIFRRMTGLPAGVETGTPEPSPSTNRPQRDARGRRMPKAPVYPPTPRSMDLLLKAALAAERQQGVTPLRQATAVLEYYIPARFYTLTGPGTGHGVDMRYASPRDVKLSRDQARDAADAVALAQDVEMVAERLIERPQSEEHTARARAMLDDARDVARVWGGAGKKRPPSKPRRSIKTK